MGLPEDKYTTDDYLRQNPSWDLGDSPWKAAKVESLIESSGLSPRSIFEVGCGAGGILAALAAAYPDADCRGYEIAGAAARFWPAHKRPNLRFEVGDFLTMGTGHCDLLLLLDVIEHVSNPHAFLSGLRGRTDYCLLHIPLDLSALSVARESPLLDSRRKVGHINYFTKNLALELLRETGYEVLRWEYSGAAFTSPQATLKTRIAALPRMLAALLGRDFGARLLGGETLFVLARGAGNRN